MTPPQINRCQIVHDMSSLSSLRSHTRDRYDIYVVRFFMISTSPWLFIVLQKKRTREKKNDCRVALMRRPRVQRSTTGGARLAKHEDWPLATRAKTWSSMDKQHNDTRS